MHTIGSPQVSKNHKAIVFIVSGESINDSIIFYDSVPSLTLRDDSGVKVDSGSPLLWCP